MLVRIFRPTFSASPLTTLAGAGEKWGAENERPDGALLTPDNLPARLSKRACSATEAEPRGSFWAKHACFLRAGLSRTRNTYTRFPPALTEHSLLSYWQKSHALICTPARNRDHPPVTDDARGRESFSGR